MTRIASLAAICAGYCRGIRSIHHRPFAQTHEDRRRRHRLDDDRNRHRPDDDDPAARHCSTPAWCERRTSSLRWLSMPRSHCTDLACCGLCSATASPSPATGRMDRNPRAIVSAGAWRFDGVQPAAKTIPEALFMMLPDDVRDHHRRAGGGLGRGPHALLGIPSYLPSRGS